MKQLLVFISSALILASVFFVYTSLSKSNLAKSNPSPNVGLQTEFVCMVNDAFMGIKQFPVPVNDKMYYGCCEQCVDKIKNQRQFRYANDPLSGEEVDKALAFIVRKSEIDPSVWYFKSKENYIKFLEASK